MDVLGLEREELRVDLLRQAATAAEVEADRVLGRRRRDVDLARPELAGASRREIEERTAETRSPPIVAHVQELELEPVARSPDEAALEHARADEASVLERAPARSAAVEAVEQ